MSIRIITQAWLIKGLPPAEKLVLVALADHADGAAKCFPGMRRLAERTGLSIRSVERATAALVSAGHVSRTRRAGRGYDYHVHPRRLDGSTPDTVTGDLPDTESGQNYKMTRQGIGSDPSRDRATPDTVAACIEPSKNHQRTAISRSNSWTMIPEDWRPAVFPEGTESAKIYRSWTFSERGAQLEHFKAYNASKGTKSADWQQAWSAWVLNSRRFQRDRRRDEQKPLWQVLSEARNP